MKLRSAIPNRPSIVHGVAVMCVAVFVANAHTARAGINVWTSHGPEAVALAGGQINTVAADPATPGTVYAGTGFLSTEGESGDGAVFKSTDGGGTWTATGLAQNNIAILALAIDPATPRTLYAAAGCGGVFKSTDGGSTWNAANLGLVSANISRVAIALAIDPTAPSTLYVGTIRSALSPSLAGGGVFKSTDGGMSWQGVNTDLNYTNALAIDPVVPSTVYAGQYDPTGINGAGGVFKSTDGGGAWSSTGGFGPFHAIAPVRALAIDPVTAGTLYAGLTRTSSFSASLVGPGVSKTTDGGTSWQSVNNGLTSGLVTAVAIDPQTPNTLYVGTLFGGAFKSTDGATSWAAFNAGLPTNSTVPSGTDVLALAIDRASPHTLYAGTYGGVFAMEEIAALCAGDCGGTHTVAVNDVITLVDIALGTVQPTACSDGGLPLGGGVDVAVIIEAVNNALNGCPSSHL